MFWLENIAWLGLFLVYEVALAPFVYFKNILNVAIGTQGTVKKIFSTLAWLFTGPFYILFFILRDLFYLFQILSWH